jgi:hypothetical protein
MGVQVSSGQQETNRDTRKFQLLKTGSRATFGSPDSLEHWVSPFSLGVLERFYKASYGLH